MSGPISDAGREMLKMKKFGIINWLLSFMGIFIHLFNMNALSDVKNTFVLSKYFYVLSLLGAYTLTRRESSTKYIKNLVSNTNNTDLYRRSKAWQMEMLEKTS